MLKLYFVFILLGALGLTYSLIFGGEDAHSGLDDGADAGDTFDDSPKIFSFRVIFSFLLAFGIGGGAMFYSDKTIGPQIIVGLISGILTGAFSWWMMSILYKFQGASNVDSDDFIGHLGDIVIGTTPNGKSKVRVNALTGTIELLCKEENGLPLKIGDTVKISGKIGTLLIVSKQ